MQTQFEKNDEFNPFEYFGGLNQSHLSENGRKDPRFSGKFLFIEHKREMFAGSEELNSLSE